MNYRIFIRIMVFKRYTYCKWLGTPKSVEE